MKTYPLESLTIEEATKVQFRLVDEITKEFNGKDILTMGDLGVASSNNMPLTTFKVEKVISKFFNQESASLVRGAGTGAIFQALSASMKSNDKILVHTSEIYETTKVSFKQLNLQVIQCNFNNLDEIIDTLAKYDIKGALIQYSRQSINDSYDIKEVIKTIKSVKDIPIIVDDNYTTLKVKKIGVELGADLSCFSSFKLLGPQGVGVIVGKKKYLDTIKTFHYSGGSQVQGFEAMEVLRGMVYAPVALAIQATQLDEIVKRLNEKEIDLVEEAVIANAQSKVVLVKLSKPIAKDVLKHTVELGGAAHPIGAESKFEISPMFYRLSKTMRDENIEYENQWIRINPMRSSASTVIRILKEAIEKVK